MRLVEIYSTHRNVLRIILSISIMPDAKENSQVHEAVCRVLIVLIYVVQSADRARIMSKLLGFKFHGIRNVLGVLCPLGVSMTSNLKRSFFHGFDLVWITICYQRLCVDGYFRKDTLE